MVLPSQVSAGKMSEYEHAAGNFKPAKIKILFIAESPPAFKSEDKKSYFFFVDNPGTDILFAAIIKATFDIKYRKSDGNKFEMLRRFQNAGFWLIDAVNWPINKVNGNKRTDRERARVIREAVPDLLSKLSRLKKQVAIDHQTGIILIKKLVHEVLYSVLTKQRYNVLNNAKIDFPKYYRDEDTIEGIRSALLFGNCVLH